MYKPWTYESLGVRPIINARGTFTAISGSTTLPEVKAAMEAASFQYVDLDELMEAVSRRLAVIAQASWAIVTCGCEAAISLATAAAIAGVDPEKAKRLPDLTGMRNEVILPTHSRNPYEVGVRAMGARLVEVSTPSELEQRIGAQTAMVYALASLEEQRSDLSVAALCDAARRHDVPVFVDAAAEPLTIPNLHLAAGAALVGYSGGKCMRGPQTAGLLLGREDLVRAAWFHSAPHQNIGRALKVGKEEIMGMLAAAEMWLERDHKAEWAMWEHWLQEIASAVQDLPTMSTEILLPEGLSNHAPRLRLRWNPGTVPISGEELLRRLDAGTPRIQLAEAAVDSVTIMPYMLEGDQHRVVAGALRAALEAALSSTDIVR